MVNIRRQSQIRIAAALVGGHDQCPLLYLKLNETKAWSLVAFCSCGTKKQYIVFTASFFLVYTFDEWWQFFQIGGVAVYEDGAAVVPPVDSGFPVFFYVTLTLHK